MILLKFNYKILIASVLALVMISCSNPWDDREDNGDDNLNISLNEAIINRSEVSQFAKLLVETGYDKTLAASKSYTVFVPTNEAMDQIDQSILNNPEALKEFVGNHITLTAYPSERTDQETKIKMFSSKYLIFKENMVIDDATIVNPDNYAKNGIFHIINKALTPKLNIWEYVKSQVGTSATSDYLLSLKEFNIYKSDSIGKAVSEINGSGYLADSLTNSYLKNVYNLNNEKNSYTFFLMEDVGYNLEVDKMKPYLTKTTNNPAIDSTAIYAKYFTLRDMAFVKKYERNVLPDTLISKFGVKVPVDKTQIVQEIQLSNGIVYIMKKVDVPLSKRLLITKIEGEKNDSFFNFGRNRMFYRDRKDPSGLLFQDVLVQNPGTSNAVISYSAKDFYSTKYRVFWRAINDDQTNVFQQILSIYGSSKVINNVTTPVDPIVDYFSYINVERNFYEDVFIGEFTLTEARDIGFIRLGSANTSTNGNNSLTLDYLKFIPVLK